MAQHRKRHAFDRCDRLSQRGVARPRMTLGDCIKSGRYGLVMGPSNVYGFGVPSDAHTIPSRLGEMLGLPFANIGLPEGHTRNLFAILLNIITRSAQPPAECCCCRAAILPGGL